MMSCPYPSGEKIPRTKTVSERAIYDPCFYLIRQASTFRFVLDEVITQKYNLGMVRSASVAVPLARWIKSCGTRTGQDTTTSPINLVIALSSHFLASTRFASQFESLQSRTPLANADDSAPHVDYVRGTGRGIHICSADTRARAHSSKLAHLTIERNETE